MQHPCGWYLIDGRLQRPFRAAAAFLSESASVRLGSVWLPVMPSGRVHEIVFLREPVNLPDGLSIRRLRAFERAWRMAWRVFNTWKTLDRPQRRACGLTLWRALRDLKAAYRIATRFRGLNYATWCVEVEAHTPQDRSAIAAQIAQWSDGPRFVIRRLAGEEDAWEKTLASLDDQLYRRFVLHDELAFAPQSDDWLMLLRPGDRLAPHALFWIAHLIRQSRDVLAVYWDDDEMDAAGERLRPRFKPDWSRLHLEATDFIGRAVAVKYSLLDQGEISAASSLREVILRLTQETDRQVAHIPAVLLHRLAGEKQPVCYRVPVSVPQPAPKVSIVIPSRDAAGLLRQCVESVLARTAYPDFELLVIDNRSHDLEAQTYLAELSCRLAVRVLRWNKRFNYSAINNFAAQKATGQVLCLLNNDTEVITPDWLAEMVGHLCRERVGVVGAKLYYPDDRVQHAGVIVGPGRCASHLHLGIARDDPGYCNRAVVAQEFSAVTAACMLTWRDLYLRLGGLKAFWLPVAFNDVDYCLRVRRAGYKVVWTPHAELYHHESASRGKDIGWWREFRAWRELTFMRWKWRTVMKNDPFYNPNFSYLRPDFAFGPVSMVRGPWTTMDTSRKSFATTGWSLEEDLPEGVRSQPVTGEYSSNLHNIHAGDGHGAD